jgi:DNA-binding Xre family transcriptional regulator
LESFYLPTGMIKTRIHELALSNQVRNAYQLQKLLSVSPSMAARLFKDDVHLIGLQTIESICTAFSCNPGDLFVFVDDQRDSKGD